MSYINNYIDKSDRFYLQQLYKQNETKNPVNVWCINGILYMLMHIYNYITSVQNENI